MNFGIVAWEPGISNVQLYKFCTHRYVKKPGSSARCHTYKIGHKPGGGKKRGMKGSRRVRKAN